MEKIIDTLLQGGPGVAALVFMFIIYSQNRKKEVSNEEILKQIYGLEVKALDIKNNTDWLKDAHNHIDEDGSFVWHIKRSMLREQSEIKKVLQDLHMAISDIHKGQEKQTAVLERLTEKIIRIDN